MPTTQPSNSYGATGSAYNPSGASSTSGGGYGSGKIKPAASRFGRLAQFGMSGGSGSEGTGGGTGEYGSAVNSGAGEAPAATGYGRHKY